MTHDATPHRDPVQGTPPDAVVSPLTSMDVSQDHGVEMFSKTVVISLGTFFALWLLMLFVQACDYEMSTKYARPDVEARKAALIRADR